MAVATGVGSWPGRSMDRALDEVSSVLGWVPFLPELPQRGRESGMVGRALGLVDGGRAAELLRADVDTWLAALPAAPPGPQEPTVSVCGPVTLAAATGSPVEEVTARLSAAVAGWVREVAVRAGRAVALQLDEPLLDRTDERAFAQLVTLVGGLADAGCDVLVHSCATPPPVGPLLALGARASVDVTRWPATAPAWPSGWRAGVVPTTGPLDAAAAATRLRQLVGPADRERLVVTPTCGLGLSSDAGGRLRACAAVVDLLGD